MKTEIKLPSTIKAITILTRIDPQAGMVIVDITTQKAWIVEGRNGYGPECWDVRVGTTVACLNPKNIYQMLMRDEDTGFFYEVVDEKEVQKILDYKLMGKPILGNLKNNRFVVATPESLRLTKERMLELVPRSSTYFVQTSEYGGGELHYSHTSVLDVMEKYKKQFE